MSDHLIEPRALAEILGSTEVCDIRWRINDPGYGRRSYEAGHIPGAIRVDLDDDLSAPPGPGRHPLPTPARFAATLGRLGLMPTSNVVVYDDVSGRVAARMWWMLRSIGHDSVRVLNGGFRAWEEAGLPVSIEDSAPQPAVYPTPDRFEGVVGIDDLDDRTVVDVREAERYQGLAEPVDPIPGHIPGAINLPSGLSLKDGVFKSIDELDAIYGQLDSPVMSCGSGVVACHSALAMAVAGRPIPDVYIGSYSEWSRSGRPVAAGDQP